MVQGYHLGEAEIASIEVKGPADLKDPGTDPPRMLYLEVNVPVMLRGSMVKGVRILLKPSFQTCHCFLLDHVYLLFGYHFLMSEQGRPSPLHPSSKDRPAFASTPSAYNQTAHAWPCYVIPRSRVKAGFALITIESVARRAPSLARKIVLTILLRIEEGDKRLPDLLYHGQALAALDLPEGGALRDTPEGQFYVHNLRSRDGMHTVVEKNG